MSNNLANYLKEWQGNISGDLKGGISSGIITLPIALAFGQASGLGAIAGLYGAIILSMTVTLFGGTKTQISSPVGVILVTVIFIINYQLQVSAAEIGEAASSAATLSHALPYVFLTFFLAGLIQIIFGLLRLGTYIQYLPYPVVSGFSTGIGLLIIVLQVQDLFGLNVPSHEAFKLAELLDPQYLISIEGRLLLAIGAIVLILISSKLTQAVPGTLVALLVMSSIPYVIDWDNFNTVQMPAQDGMIFQTDILKVLSNTDALLRCGALAFSLAIISSINTLLTSLAADNLTADRHMSNKELLGQGLGNSLLSLVGGMPGGGAVACTVNNIKAGGRTRLSALISTIMLILVVVLASGVIEKIPVPVLDGILIYIGYLIIDKKSFKHIGAIPVMDTIIMLIVAILTAYGELLYAVVAGLSMASIYFMKKMADVVELDTKYAKVDRLVDNLIDTFEDSDKFRKQVYIKNIKGPVFFGFASRFSNSLKTDSEAEAVLLNLGSVPYIDQSGAYTLEREITKLKERGMLVCLSEVNKKSLKLLEDIEVIPDLIKKEFIFPSVEECIVWLKEPGHINPSEEDLSVVYIPTAFTPNNDGSNDSWDIKRLDLHPNCSVKIYTREGQELFSSVGYKEPWNGMYKNTLLPVDKYKYEIKLDTSKEEKIEGFVSIFR